MLDLSPVLGLLRDHTSFVLTTHVASDGDGLGSELALARALLSLGKRVRIVNPTPTQPRYAFLDTAREIEVYGPQHRAVLDDADVLVVMDINRWSRLGPMADDARSAPSKKTCIDHHPDPEITGLPALIDPTASATGVLVYELLRALLGSIPAGAVDPLFVAIMTDTGSFRFGNTDARTLRVASELVAIGARPDELYGRVYETSSAGRLRLLGFALTSLVHELDGRLVHFSIDRKLLESCGVAHDEVDGFTDVVRTAEKCEVVASFIETLEGGTKVSLRSKPARALPGRGVDVSRIAARFGGGGHVNASGILDARPPAVVRDLVLAALREAMTRQPGS